MRKGMEDTYWLAAHSAMVRGPLVRAFFFAPDSPRLLGGFQADGAHAYRGKDRLCFLHPGIL